MGKPESGDVKTAVDGSARQYLAGYLRMARVALAIWRSVEAKHPATVPRRRRSNYFIVARKAGA